MKVKKRNAWLRAAQRCEFIEQNFLGVWPERGELYPDPATGSLTYLTMGELALLAYFYSLGATS